MGYFVFYKTLEGHYRCLYNTDRYDTLKDLPDGKDCSYYECFKGFEANDDGLMAFKTKLIQWNDELKGNDILDIDWFKYYNNLSVVEMTFRRLCKGKYEAFEEIDRVEANWIEATHNGGLTYCSPGTCDCWGYDMTAFYPTIMGQYKFIMPYTKGVEKKLTEITDDIELGFYRVKITSSHKHATKMFSFSKNHTYTNISLEHAIELKETYDFTIELIVDDKPNAYIYPKGKRASSVFGVWLDKLGRIKSKFPKNKLIKHLMSSLWGSLSRANHITRTYDQIQAEGLKVGLGESVDYKIVNQVWTNDKEYYFLQDMSKPYRYNFRLKSFLTAYGRVQIARVAEVDLDAVRRIHTNSVAFNKKMKFNIARG